MEQLSVRSLNFTYPGQGTPALQEITLQIAAGDFVVLCGPSGCGKSTLLRQCKPILSPNGTRTGEILFCGQPIDALDQRAQSQRLGFVGQDPERQTVTDKVWHELAFGLESLGYDTQTIRRRVAEMASFFGIQTWFHRDVSELSGGQKQLLQLASVMVLEPEILLLDEPTSQLDPIAAGEFFGMLGRLNREMGTTIVLSEHRLEEALPLATQVIVLEQGRVQCAGTLTEVGETLKTQGHAMFWAMPTPLRVWGSVSSAAPCPCTVREGRAWLADFARTHPLHPLPPEAQRAATEPVLTARELWFRYERDLPDVVRGLSLTVERGEIFALLGGNGTGKSTALKLFAGVHRAHRGELQTRGRVVLLPQDPQTVFVKKTLREDLWDLARDRRETQAEQAALLAYVVAQCRLEALLDRHPYDLSGGEQQRAALAKVLLMAPDILLLDEPTKGLDAVFQRELAAILRGLSAREVSVVLVSHDLDFCARYAHRCALFFDGSIVTEGTPRAFFSGNSFYTTAANRMARPLLPQAVTADEIILACGGALPPDPDPPTPPKPETDPKPEPTPIPKPVPGASREKKPLPKRTRLAAGLILLLIPLTLFFGAYYLGDRKYYFLSLLLLLEGMAPFFLRFEGRKPPARELVVLASLCALGVAGRAAFFMLPQCKPVMALTILAGVSLGGESGFLVGAVTMLASNALFSQGPWTPWQMFAMGLIGFLAGLLAQKGLLRGTRGSLCVFGATAAVLIYGGLMNPASALLWSQTLNGSILAAYYLAGFPMDCVQAAATALFLWFAAEPVLEKLERVKRKQACVVKTETTWYDKT